jgi:hypothetical protein
MHVAMGLTMGMYLFALIMIVLNLAAFGPSLAFSRRADGDHAGVTAHPSAESEATLRQQAIPGRSFSAGLIAGSATVAAD